jgi:ribosomal-protein-serine acetyltransferase
MFTHRLADDRWLRLTQESDAPEMYELVAANREMLAEWMPWAQDTTLETTRDFIRQSVQRFAADGAFNATIVQDGRIVGSIGYPELNRLYRSCEIGYWLATAAQGRGTITLAVRALIDHAFDAWELNRVVIRAGTGNVRSRAVAERLGFTLEGVEREAGRFPDGHYIDHAVYSMLASEWPAAADRTCGPAV